MAEKTTTILQGHALQAFINKAFALLDNDEKSAITASEREAAVFELMQQYRFAPTTVDELQELHRLWLHLEYPQAAHALLCEHRPSVLAHLDAAQRPAASIRLALAEIQSLESMGDSQTLKTRLQQTAEQLAAQPRDSYTHDRWYNWNTSAINGHCFEVIEWALDKGWSAYGEAQYAWDYIKDHPAIQPFLCAQAKADLAHQCGNPDAVRQHLLQATHALHQASIAQPIDWEYWLALAEFAVEVSPEQVEHVLQAGLDSCNQQDAPPSPMLARCRQVAAARMLASACHTMGDLSGALRWAEQGFFELPHDWRFREFVLFRLELLQQAEHWLPLAQLALHCTLHGEDQVELWELAHKLLVNHSREVRMLGAVIIAFHHMDAGRRKMLRGNGITMPQSAGEQEQQALHWLNQAREHCPQHPLADLLEGWYLTRTKAPNWTKALPLLEQSLPHLPEHASAAFLGALWHARLRQLKVEEALARPFIPSNDGFWCAQLADDLQYSIANKIGKKLAPDRLEPLAQRYREEGLAHFETFWQSRQGSVFSANCSWYASLCGSLAQNHCKQQRYPKARDLYQRAIAAHADYSAYQIPHWQGLVECCLAQGDDPAAIGFAESLWHAIIEGNGHAGDDDYKEYYPGNYCVPISEALHRLGRDLEITIWLECLMQWLNDQKPEDPDTRYRLQRDCQSDALNMLCILAIRHSTAALDYLKAQINSIRAIGDSELLNKAEQLIKTLQRN